MSGRGGNKTDSENKKNPVIIIVLVVLLIAVIALVGVVAFLLGKGKGNGENAAREVASGSARTVLEESDAANIMDQMREEVAEGMFECQMSMTWTFADGEAEAKDSYVANSVNNTHPIYFDVYMGDEEEPVYSSPVIPVGSEINNIKLNRDLDPGTYEATVMYNLLDDEENQNVISSAGFVITINVLN